MPKGYIIARIDILDPEAYALRRRGDQGGRGAWRKGAGARREIRGA